MEHLLFSIEARVTEHHARDDDHIVEHSNFRLAHVKVAVVRQGTRADASKIMFLVEDRARAVDVDARLAEQPP